MPRKINWSKRATHEWVEILEYWDNRNKSNFYSSRLNESIKVILDRIVNLPESGKPTDVDLVRKKIVRPYTIYYRITIDSVDILAIWDTRRNPQKFKL